MLLCLVRHAIAAERGPDYPDDDLRPLTDDGRKKMAEAARGLAQLVRPEVILTSPLVRARQTADIVAERFALQPREERSLATGDYAAMLDALHRAGPGAVIAVGHEPWTSGLLSYLLTGDAGTLAVEVKKGAAALVESGAAGAPGSWWLRWLLQPAALRLLGRAD